MSSDKNKGTDLMKNEKVKKALVFGGLGVLLLASIYLIFAPSDTDKEKETLQSRLNVNIPQATDNKLTEDKQKAYEFSSNEKKDKDRERAIGTLAEMYNSDNTNEPKKENSEEDNSEADNRNKSSSHIDRSVREYQAASQAVSNFYENDYDYEKEQMREELEYLRQELKDMEESQSEEEKQLELLEKSYQMASKYLPSGMNTQVSTKDTTNNSHKSSTFNGLSMEVLPASKPVVSSLIQPMTDEEFAEEYSKERNMSFITPTANTDDSQKNTIACKVDRTTTIRDNETLQLRLLESVRIGENIIPRNSLLTAKSKLSGNRMMLYVTTIELGENIYPVKLTAYDMDGLEGVFIPGSDEMDALKEVGANVGGSVGTSFTFSSSAKDQILSDAARGLMQGTSNYLVKKIKTIKVTFKSGHRLMLMPTK